MVNVVPIISSVSATCVYHIFLSCALGICFSEVKVAGWDFAVKRDFVCFVCDFVCDFVCEILLVEFNPAVI